jgi:tRNA G18 (ribose-2'-O)-methylase SpoU
MDGVALSPSSADPLYRRSVRVSMGAVFGVPYARAPQWPRALEELRAAGFDLLALTPAPDAEPLDLAAARNPRRVAIVLGTEGAGLSPAAAGLADMRVRIPMQAGIDSLNVAAAAAIAFWEFGRRENPPPG